MKRFLKVVLFMLMAALALPVLPQPVAATTVAPTCAERYEKCIVQAGYLVPIVRELGDIDCFASYLGCVGGKLKFW